MRNRIIAILLSVVALSSCWKEEVRVTGIYLDATSLVIPIGGTDQLTARITPSNADDPLVLWTTSDASVVRVSDSGALTALANGTANITATSASSGLTAVCKVTVPQEVFPVESLSIDKKELVMKPGEKATIVATITPANATDQTLNWMSSDEAVATVDENGEVTAVDYGSATILVTTGDKGFIAKCLVSIPKTPVADLNLENVSNTLVLKPGETGQMVATIYPKDATEPTLKWESNNVYVASVDENGLVTAVNYGEAEITVSTTDGSGLSKSRKVLVEHHASGISIAPATLELNEYGHQKLSITFTPDDAQDKTVVWSSSDESVAIVNYVGEVYAVKTGTAVITATTKDGGLTATCIVTVYCKVAGVALDEHEITLKVDEYQELVAVVYPERANNKEITWESKDPNVAYVQGGKVFARASGTTEIVVTTKDGGFTDTCVVTVEKDVTKISIDKATIPTKPLIVDDTVLLKATVTPADATNTSFTWSTSNSNVLSVDQTGLVTAKSAGQAVICVTTKDGGFHDECTINVRNKVDKIKVSSDKEHVYIDKTTAKLSYELEPADAGAVEIEWVPEDPEAVSVSKDGTVTGKTPVKSTRIYAQTTDGFVKSDPLTLEVRRAVERINLSAKSMSLYEKESKDLGVIVVPTDASYPAYTVIYSSTDGGTVEFKDGKVTGVKPGVVTIKFEPDDEYAKEQGISSSCQVTVWEYVKSITFSNIGEDKTKIMTSGASFSINAVVSDESAHDKTLRWESSDVKSVEIVKLSEDTHRATIKANKKADNVVIKATATDSGTVEAYCFITVKEKVKDMSLSDSSLELTKGDTHTLTVELIPADPDDATVTWTSSKPDIASIDENGKIEAKSPGTTTITCMSNSNNDVKKTCEVTVVKKEVHPDSVVLDKTALQIVKGGTAQLTATVSPEAADNKAVTWSSDKPSVAKVSDSGLVTAVDVGDAVITVTTKDGGKTATCAVNVTPPPVAVSSVTLSETEITLEIKETHTLTAAVKPDNADDKTVDWNTDDPSIATVSEAGVVTAVGPGTTEITAVSNYDGTKFATCTVTVKKPISIHVTGLTIDPMNMNLYVNQTKKVTATVSPSNADDKSVTFKVPVASCIKVDSEGNVTGLKEGNSFVMVITNDGGKQKTCQVAVTMNHVVGIEVRLPDNRLLDIANGEKLILRVGEFIKLNATAIGEHSDGPVSVSGLTWTAKNKAIATESSGVIAAKAEGETTINIKSTEYQSTVNVDIPVVVLPAQSDGDNPGIEYDDWNFD